MVEGRATSDPTCRILLLGKDGQLGYSLQQSLAPLGVVTAWGRAEADFEWPQALAEAALRLAPHIIVNAAAYTDVERAQREAKRANTINAQAPAALAQVARTLGAWLIHYSTDYVFDGSGETPWREDAATAPLNQYGSSKLAAEQAIAAAACSHLIFRTSWVYAAHGNNFAKTMLRLGCERETLRVVDDQIGTPTSAHWLAEMTAQVLQQLLRGQGGAPSPQSAPADLSGIYHASASGYVSWLGYAQYLLGKAYQMGLPIKVLPQGLLGVPSSQYPCEAQRPLNSRLDTAKLTRTFGIMPPHWQAGIDELLEQWCHANRVK